MDAKSLIGRRIVGVDYMTPGEARDALWYERPIVLMLDDGTQLYPSRDPEGNGGGTIFGMDGKGRTFMFAPKSLR